MAIQKIEVGALKTKKELPNGEFFLMNYLEGWDEVTQEQQSYLCAYFDTFPKKLRACINSGITYETFNRWQKDNTFQKLLKMIERIHREELEHIEYMEAYTNSKVRGRFLKEKSEKSPKIQVNNFKTSIPNIIEDIENATK